MNAAERRDRPLTVVAAVVAAAALLASVVYQAVSGGSERDDAREADVAAVPDDTAPEPQQVVPGGLLLASPSPLDLPTIPAGPVLVEPGTGRVGSGLGLEVLGRLDVPVSLPVSGSVTTAVANIPNRTSTAGFASSLRTLVAPDPDFVMLNEVSSRSLDEMRAIAPAYDAYRDEAPDRSLGGDNQAFNNAVMWHAGRWRLVDAGRVKIVDDDRTFYNGRAVTWDRYATWAVLQRNSDAALVSVVSTHLMTNPAKYPKQHGRRGASRVQQYSAAMDRLLATVDVLAQHGPVLVGGDMNSHVGQGAWTAAAKMSAAGFGFAKDRAVMYLFHQSGVQVVGNREVRVVSDHPGIVTTLDMNGQGPE